jgi:penicillin amidase
LSKLGVGAYDHGSRARQIRDSLFAQGRFAEEDLLAILLDDRGLLLQRWHDLLLQSLRNRAKQPQYAALIPEVENWMGRAVPESVGYRLVRTFRLELITAIYDRYTAAMPVLEAPSTNKPPPRRLLTNQADEPAWRLLSERPARLVPPGYLSWEAVIDAALAKMLLALAGDKLEAFTWGSANRAGINHPLEALLGIGAVLDPPDEPSARRHLSAPCRSAGLWRLGAVRGCARSGGNRCLPHAYRPKRSSVITLLQPWA